MRTLRWTTQREEAETHTKRCSNVGKFLSVAIITTTAFMEVFKVIQLFVRKNHYHSVLFRRDILSRETCNIVATGESAWRGKRTDLIAIGHEEAFVDFEEIKNAYQSRLLTTPSICISSKLSLAFPVHSDSWQKSFFIFIGLVSFFSLSKKKEFVHVFLQHQISKAMMPYECH